MPLGAGGGGMTQGQVEQLLQSMGGGMGGYGMNVNPLLATFGHLLQQAGHVGNTGIHAGGHGDGGGGGGAHGYPQYPPGGMAGGGGGEMTASMLDALGGGAGRHPLMMLRPQLHAVVHTLKQREALLQMDGTSLWSVLCVCTQVTYVRAVVCAP